MRLFTIIDPRSPAPLDESVLGPKLMPQKLPLWVLEASREEYDRFRAHRLFEALAVTEAAIDRYAQMISSLKAVDQAMADVGYRANYHDMAYRELQWAMQALRREDRVIWFMRFVKLSILWGALQQVWVPDGRTTGPNEARPQSSEENQRALALEQMVQQEFKKARNNLRKKVPNAPLPSDPGGSVLGRQKTNLEHFVGMNNPAINAIVWSDQTPSDLIGEFSKIEYEWQRKRQQIVDVANDPDIKSILEFPDGTAWFDLGRASCDMEASAMGHCGNSPNYGSTTQRVFSYRVPVRQDGTHRKPGEKGTLWKPRMTFIFHSDTGMLGEMKGRANKKPKPELHPYIIALLKQPFIKGIAGGGYLPEENFAMSDLDEDVRIKLITDKPGLGTLRDIYNIAGKQITPELIDKMKSIMDGSDIEYIEFTEDQKYLLIERQSLSDFVLDNGGDIAKYVWDISTGGDHMDWYGEVSDDEAIDLAEDYFRQNKSVWKALQEYMKTTYPEPFGLTDEDEEDEDDYVDVYDIDDVGDVLRVADEEGDGFLDAFRGGVRTGYEMGAEGEAMNSLRDWIKDPFDSSHHLDFITMWSGNWDGDIGIKVATTSLLDILDTTSEDFETLTQNGWKEFMGFTDLDQPYSGWTGFDEVAALERAGDDLDIPVFPEKAFPVPGNADSKDVDRFLKALKEDGETHRSGVSRWVHFPELNVNLLSSEVINGVVVFNCYALPGDRGWGGSREAFLKAMTLVKQTADQLGITVALDKHNEGTMSPAVLALGFKDTQTGYFRYDPAVTEGTRIKLGGPGKAGPKAFMDEVHQKGQAHPFDPRAILFGPVSVELSIWEGMIHISDIRTYQDHGTGKATEVVRMLMDMADRHGVKLTGIAKAYSDRDEHVRDTKQLAKWYKKLGFKIVGGYPEDGYEILYTPSGIKESGRFRGPVEEPDYLMEGRKDRYAQMLAGLNAIDPRIYNAVMTTVLPDVVSIMQREDRIVWYLKWYRLLRLAHAIMDGDPEENPTVFKLAVHYLEKVGIRTRGKKLDVLIAGVLDKLSGKLSLTFFEHIFSLNIPKIDNFVFQTQEPEQLIREFREIERDWQRTRSQYIDMDKDRLAQKFIEFPDGSAWFHLNRPYCSIEGEAMGHCGNSPDADNSDLTVLSYRVPVQHGGKKLWRPRMTFILNTRTGMLGEMKGRGNKKPIPELHPYIVKLLEHPEIKGIKGGGYLPEENFSMDDLSKQDRDRLIRLKPMLGGLRHMYRLFGMTPTVAAMINEMLSDTNLSEGEPNNDGTLWTLQRYRSIGEAAVELGNVEARDAAYVATGGFLTQTSIWKDGHLDIFATDSEVVDLLGYVKRNTHIMWSELQKHLSEEYPTEFKGDGGGAPLYDINNPSEIHKFLKEYDLHDLSEPLEEAITEAKTAKIGEAMKSAIDAWFESIQDDSEKPLDLMVESNGAYSLVISVPDLIDLIGDGVETSDSWADLLKVPGFSIDQVDTSEFDMKTAYSNLEDMRFP